MQEYQHFIDGTFRRSSAESVKNISPQNGEELGFFHEATLSEWQAAEAAAQTAQTNWQATSLQEKQSLLRRFRQNVSQQAEHLASTITAEEGKAPAEAKAEIDRALTIMDYYIDLTEKAASKQSYPSQNCTRVEKKNRPLGTVVLITPWNFPVCIPIWKIMPAFVSGNAVIIKPSELSPASLDILAHCWQDACADTADAKGPTALLQVLYAKGKTFETFLRASKTIAGISFTGSTQVGNKLIALAGEKKCKIQTEMGGNNPTIISASANIRQAAEETVFSAFGSAGQRCTATSRLLVEESIFEECIDTVIQQTKKAMPQPTVVVSREAKQQIIKQVERLLAEGAKLLHGEIDHADTALLDPLLLTEVSPDSSFFDNEIFGPVLVCESYKNFADAITSANKVTYGLSSALYSSKQEEIDYYEQHSQAGMLHINVPSVYSEPHVPFGGLKKSSFGCRELGEAALDFYSTSQSIYQK